MVHWVIIIIITIMLRSTCVLSIDDDETYPYILIDDSSFRKNDFYPHQQANQLYGVDDNGGMYARTVPLVAYKYDGINSQEVVEIGWILHCLLNNSLVI